MHARLLAWTVVALALLPAVGAPRAAAKPSEAETVTQAAAVLQQIMAVPASAIPEQLLQNAQAVAIVPEVKGGAFIIGVRKGHGVLVARDDQGQWRAPQFIELTGGSVGWQAGIQSTDVVLVFRSRQSLANLMQGKLTIGAEASAAAGPVGRQASAATDLALQSEIYSYSRSRGAFLGVSLDGTMLAPDRQADARYYPAAAPGVAPVVPPAAQQLVALVASTSRPAAVDGPPSDPSFAAVPTPAAAEAALAAQRQQATVAWQQLSSRLDPQWRAYLAPPDEALQGPQSAAALAAMQTCLEHYGAVSTDPRYAALQQQPEFQAARTSLQAVLDLQRQAAGGGWQLPPPPAAPQASGSAAP